MMRGGAVAARLAHNHAHTGSSPVPATNHGGAGWALFLAACLIGVASYMCG